MHVCECDCMFLCGMCVFYLAITIFVRRLPTVSSSKVHVCLGVSFCLLSVIEKPGGGVVFVKWQSVAL